MPSYIASSPSAFDEKSLVALFVALPVLFILLLVWSLFWKGLALWHTARRGHTGWFVALLFINTLGILEIIYLFAIAKLKWKELFSKKT